MSERREFEHDGRTFTVDAHDYLCVRLELNGVRQASMMTAADWGRIKDSPEALRHYFRMQLGG